MTTDTREALADLVLNVTEAMRTGGWVPTPLYQSFFESLQNAKAALETQPAAQPSAQCDAVAWCALTPSGKIAYFEGKPMVMPGPVGNEHHPHALVLASAPATPAATAQAAPLTDEQIEAGRHATFSTGNPYCPCDSKTMRKAVRWAEAQHRIGIAPKAAQETKA